MGLSWSVGIVGKLAGVARVCMSGSRQTRVGCVAVDGSRLAPSGELNCITFITKVRQLPCAADALSLH
jgi:hypothetical protein